MTKQELISIASITGYVVRKLFDELNRKNLIAFLKTKSIEVRLSEVLCAQLRPDIKQYGSDAKIIH